MKVSVVTVCYNSVNTIEKTINSVIVQDYEDIEYIIIDGGSVDGTLDVINKYKENISVIISEPDSGTYDAMNKGIARATGDIIGFINSDDWYADGAINAIVEAFSKTDADIVYGKYVIVENGKYREVNNRNLNDICFDMVFGHPATFVKSYYMKKHPFDVSYRIAADYEFLLTMYFQNKCFHEIDVIIAYFRAGGASSHPFETYMESKKVSLRLSKGKVSNARYLAIRNHYRKARFLPIYSFLLFKLRSRQNYSVRKCFEKHEFIFYGAGYFGKKFLATAREFGLNIVSFWDSNISLHGSTVEGVPIQAPCPKDQQHYNAIILITTIKENNAIVRKLQSLGYERKKDFLNIESWLGWLAKVWTGRE